MLPLAIYTVNRPQFYGSGIVNPFSKSSKLIGIALIALIHTFAGAQAPPAAEDEVRLVILGIDAGRTSWRGSEGGGFSAAVKVGSDVYLVDFGRNSMDRYFQAGLGPPGPQTMPGGLETLRAAFITHLHGDHVVDFPRLVLFGFPDGAADRDEPIRIFGPGPRGELPPVSRFLANPSAIVNPLNPTPGTRDMFESIMAAFATDLNYGILDSGRRNPVEFLDVRDIRIPPEIGASPTDLAPLMQPFEVYADESVSVTAVLVDHAPVFPAFAFRFDTARGSIVFSGDTGPHPNVVTLAQGADLLVHEVIDGTWADNLFPEPRSGPDAAAHRHLLESHTDIRVLGDIARRANVGTLILAHSVPPDLTQEDVDTLVTGFGGDAILAQPFMEWRLESRD